MAVFRVEKTKDFTVMSNHHFRNRELSLKAKGLLSFMLSLPDEWDYTLEGLAKLNKDGIPDWITPSSIYLKLSLSVSVHSFIYKHQLWLLDFLHSSPMKNGVVFRQ